MSPRWAAVSGSKAHPVAAAPSGSACRCSAKLTKRNRMIEQSPALLVVDDDADILSSLSIHLRADGYRVLRASGGKEAVAVLAKELPALAIVDLMMPGMDGFETSRQIK